VTTDLERAIADLVAIGAVAEGTPRHDIRDLVVSHARSLAGLDACTSLETLSLIGCAIGDYAVASRLPNLRVLVIENSDLTNVAWATALPLQVAVMRRNRLRDGTPLLGLTTIQSLDLTGNPLDEQSRTAAVAGESDRLCWADDDETAEANIRLADAAIGVVAYRREGSLWACATGLDLTPTPEAGHVETTVAQLNEVARGALRPEQLLGLDR
jgi:hypothetical protein